MWQLLGSSSSILSRSSVWRRISSPIPIWNLLSGLKKNTWTPVDGRTFNRDCTSSSRKPNTPTSSKSHTPDEVPVQGTLKTPHVSELSCGLCWFVCSVATGSKHQHKHEEEQLLMEALGLAQWDPKDVPKGVQWVDLLIWLHSSLTSACIS